MKRLLCASILIALVASLSAPASDHNAPKAVTPDQAYQRYVNATVREPFPDLINLAVPQKLEDQRTAALGFVDVTKAPFRADPTGAKDATRAIQDAINFARDHQMVCFFPPGTYRIADTLECVQQLYRRSNGRVLGGHQWPCILVGSRTGTARPKLVLAPRSPAFDDPQRPKYVVHFWARGYLNDTTAGRVGDGFTPEQDQPNISMNQMFVGLDLVVGEGNPGAVGIRHQAAEGSAIEDCTMDVTHGLIGIQGGIGSGGGSVGVTVIGGKIGLNFTGYLSGTQPTPTITGFTLIGQTQTAIRSTSRQTLVAAGLKIIASKTAGPLIDCAEPSQLHNGQLSLVDSEIIFDLPAGAPAKDRLVIASNRSVYLNHVYVRGATQVAVDGDGTALLAGNADDWLLIREFARAQPTGTLRTSGVSLEYRYPIHVDGERKSAPLVEVVTGQAPPPDLQSRHLWPRDFPHWEQPGAANVKSAPWKACGDGRADDTAALQRAIDASEVVFLPKGIYRLTRPLELKPHTKLIGVGQHLSLLVATGDGAFADAKNPAPLVRTADTADASTVLAFLGLFAAHDLAGVQALHWRSGGRSIFRAIEIQEQPIRGYTIKSKAEREAVVPRHVPLVLITGQGGGNWYNFRGESAYNQAPAYRHLLIDGARGPLNFYQCSPQHVIGGEYAVEIRNARRISFFGTKYEGNRTLLWIRDADHIRHFGHGGNGKPLPDGTLFRIERTPNFLFANLVEGPTKIEPVTAPQPKQDTTDPRLWSMLIERPATGSEIRMAPLERPVLYKRGRPE